MGAGQSGVPPTVDEVQGWSPETVVAKLGEIGQVYLQYGPAITENGVDGAMLLTLTADDLEDLDISKNLHKKKILAEIEKLNGGASSSEGGVVIDEGTKLGGGRFTVQRFIAKGGMAEVWLAHDDVMGREVAIRVPQTADMKLRMEQESRFLGRLNHPNIMDVHDFRKEGTLAYMVCEYLDGQTLEDRLKAATSSGGVMQEAEIILVAAGVLEGLAMIHSKGFVHRDIVREERGDMGDD